MTLPIKYDEDRVPRVFYIVVGIALVITCVLRSQIHFHMNQPGSQLISLNETTEQLQKSARIHDSKQETDAATEDYRQLLKASDFKEMPTHYKDEYRELVARRRFAKDPDYVDELICHDDVLRWKKERLPLKVYIAPSTSSDGFSEIERSFIIDSLNQWMAVVPNKLSYVVVENEKAGDIRYSSKKKQVELSNSSAQLGHCIPVCESAFVWNIGSIARANVDIGPAKAKITAPGSQEGIARHRVILHETGHALGVSGHSCNANDKMFFVDSDENELPKLTERDKNTLRTLYETEKLEQRAEKVIRSEAAKGNGNAILHLIANIAKSEKDSPERRQKIFQLTKQAADMGITVAQVALGYHYRSGKGVQKDVSQAVNYWTRAAENESESAYLALADLFVDGSLVPKDVNRADYCFKRALSFDSSYAESEYAHFLCYERGDKKSIADAIEHYKVAARSLSTVSMARLARLYSGDWSGKKDLAQANHWTNKVLDVAKSIKPTTAESYLRRSAIWELMNKPHAAMADLDAAEKLNPKLKNLHRSRAKIYSALGEADKAVLEMNQAIKEDPEEGFNYQLRQCYHLAESNWSGAVSDLGDIRKFASDSGKITQYSLIYGTIAARLAHDASEQALLNETRSAVNLRCWPGPLVVFLSGKLTGKQLEDIARGDEQGAEAHAMLGLDDLAKGNRESARKHFQWIIAYGDTQFLEYDLATNLLKRLDASSI